ncbi:MAG: hypothetical protein DI626_01325 [Micavibrio aeruginosavorus]|uniref:Uncharacterized protein n=1 Tax=Micavibrio aeruginosavorus TaxID=349221 RepID=A0A2W5A260_9BACT|nr:MAG: hypothetical protein DI626_01325 [Micavibrio aeruginosavorus]
MTVIPDPVSLSDRFVAVIERSYDDKSICRFVNAPRDHHKGPSKKSMINDIAEQFLQIAPLKPEDVPTFKKTFQDAILSRASNIELLYDLEAPMHALRCEFREITLTAAEKAAHKNLVLKHGVSCVANDNRAFKMN